MKKITTFLLGFAAPFYFAQQAGDVVNIEQKLNLTPEGIFSFISNNLGEQNKPDFVNYLHGLKIGVKAYKITYYTKNENNILVKATGLIMYPNVNYKLSTVVSDHGTTDNRNNVPSNLKGILTLGFAIELSYVLNGYILMAPDYVGMGSGDGVHPYMHYPTEASATIDFVTAANKVLAQLGVNRYNEYFLAGYSQGAHAAMSTLKKLNTSNPDNLKFKYAYLGAGPYDLSGATLQKGILEQNTYPSSSIIANIINTCNNTGYKTYNNNISEIISNEFLNKYNYHVVQDNGGMLWGPIIWRKLFTNNFVNDVTNNQNNKLRQCVKSNNVYDWYNKTPLTLGHATIDFIVHPENTSKTINTQRGYYPLMDLNKYNLQTSYWGPVGHIGGVIPFVLASNAKFNSLRSGGIFNQLAKLGSKQIGNNKSNTNSSFYSSQINPNLQDMKLVEITNFNDGKTGKFMPETNLSSLKDGVYLLKVSDNDNIESKLIPYVKSTPDQVTENEIIQSENNGILKLKISPDELNSIYIFDNDKKLINTISYEQYIENNGIDIKKLDNQNYTFEVVTPYYNLQFNKVIGGNPSLENGTNIYAQKQQIVARSSNDIKNISIYSISGSLIIQQEVNRSLFESRNLESGVYLVQITLSNGKVINKKIKL